MVEIVQHCLAEVATLSSLVEEIFESSFLVGIAPYLSLELLPAVRIAKWMANECYLLTFDLGNVMPDSEGCFRSSLA